MQGRERWISGAMALVFLLCITLPYINAQGAADDNHVFGGFLINPIDGNSYLAKIRQGWEGAWTFQLPYTAHPGQGAAINLYYIFLGHVAKWLDLSLLLMFHAARILGATLLCAALYRLIASIFSNPAQRLWAFGLALFGSGLGWIAAALGGFTSDFWVAEAYPFLSSYANAHFPIGLALQIWLLTPLAKAGLGRRQMFLTAVMAAFLSIVYPFGWAVAIAVLTVMLIWDKLGSRVKDGQRRHWSAVVVGGLPFAVYSLWIVKSHPILSLWDRQNITTAPPVVDLLISFSPALLVALAGAYLAIKRTGSARLLAVWLVVGVLLVYFPSALQRRFISGLYVPIATLAALAIFNLRNQARTLAAALVLILSLPTNLLILLGGIQAANSQNSSLILLKTELSAFQWLDEHASSNSLVMASPQNGNRIPAYADVRVVYGHPFETVEGRLRIQEVQDFYVNSIDPGDYVSSQGIDYVLYGPEEKAIGSFIAPSDWQIVFSSGDVTIYATSK